MEIRSGSNRTSSFLRSGDCLTASTSPAMVSSAVYLSRAESASMSRPTLFAAKAVRPVSSPALLTQEPVRRALHLRRRRFFPQQLDPSGEFGILAQLLFIAELGQRIDSGGA